jgi:hypothetical protein
VIAVRQPAEDQATLADLDAEIPDPPAERGAHQTAQAGESATAGTRDTAGRVVITSVQGGILMMRSGLGPEPGVAP